jgi:hypothetical protein
VVKKLGVDGGRLVVVLPVLAVIFRDVFKMNR